MLELLHRPHQADVALLDQIQEAEAAVQVLLGDGHHQAQVGLGQLLTGALHEPLGPQAPLGQDVHAFGFQLHPPQDGVDLLDGVLTALAPLALGATLHQAIQRTLAVGEAQQHVPFRTGHRRLTHNTLGKDFLRQGRVLDNDFADAATAGFHAPRQAGFPLRRQQRHRLHLAEVDGQQVAAAAAQVLFTGGRRRRGLAFGPA